MKEYRELTPIFSDLVEETVRRLAAESPQEAEISEIYKKSRIESVQFTGNGFFVYFTADGECVPDYRYTRVLHGETNALIGSNIVGFILFYREEKLCAIDCHSYSDTGTHPFPDMEEINGYSFFEEDELDRLIKDPKFRRKYF